MNPKNIIRFQNGMVMVFGEDGQQMPEYQGWDAEVYSKLEALDLTSTSFSFGVWKSHTTPVSAEEFFQTCKLSQEQGCDPVWGARL
ncbi:MAG: hypothetical protein HY785_24785 [Oscillatoriophycideae cyanobacterium NC_groundwater_1537_Pr4_S-0.65um_50_18]|nr:hypothetical protein [Oscillatoriophycideae cyanobacterium NC_groundwater_1537_Pr4_S-0.65um_50_18]